MVVLVVVPAVVAPPEAAVVSICSNCSNCGGATSRGGSHASTCTNTVVEKEFKIAIKRKEGQLIEVSFQVDSESFPWDTYSCGGVGCGIGSSSTSRGSSG